MGNNTATTTPATGELVYLDPADLIVDENVRTDTAGYAACWPPWPLMVSCNHFWATGHPMAP